MERVYDAPWAQPLEEDSETGSESESEEDEPRSGVPRQRAR